jgi:hypothetical protein
MLNQGEHRDVVAHIRKLQATMRLWQAVYQLHRLYRRYRPLHGNVGNVAQPLSTRKLRASLCWELCEMRRYVIVQEPLCDWAVRDTAINVPTTVDGHVTIGLSLNEAIVLAAKANSLCSATKLPVKLLALAAIGRAA